MLEAVQERPVAVKRIRCGVAVITWPTESQMYKRGCTPYIQFKICERTWRIHFRLPFDHRHKRPSTLAVKSQGERHELFLKSDQSVPVEVLSVQTLH